MTTPTVSNELLQTQSIHSSKKNSPQSMNSRPSTCQHCQFYKLEGRRGGHCQQIEALVRGSWRACALVLPPFAQGCEVASKGLKLRYSVARP